ncbi:MAG: S26 family signal peptidase [Nitrospirae bacterium]|nr:S26 family signal peptidase [Nitrospirota bacterium]
MYVIGRDEFAALASEVLKRGKNLSFIAQGASMSPFIKSGDTLKIKPLKGTPGVGDIVLLKDGAGRSVVHRITGKTKDGIITQGDANSFDDGLVTCDNLLGKVYKVSGRGYTFHLRFPFSYFIAKGILSPKKFSGSPLILSLLKKIADFLG